MFKQYKKKKKVGENAKIKSSLKQKNIERQRPTTLPHTGINLTSYQKGRRCIL
jgi:hypothetical protein